MYISPTHPNPPRPREAPEDDGELIVAIPRERENAELRIAIKKHLGHAFINVQQFNRDELGQWWPSPNRHVTIRRRELAEAIEALTRAAEMLEGEAEDRPARRDTRPAQRQARQDAPQRPIRASDIPYPGSAP